MDVAMAWLALVLYVVGLALGFGIRMVVGWRRDRDTGIRLHAGPVGSPAWWAGVLIIVAWVLGVLGPLTGILGVGRVASLPVAVYVAGAVIAVAGSVVMLVSQAGMGASWRVGVDDSEHTDLVTTGVFGFVRNPIFTAMIASSAGIFLLAPTVVSLLATLLSVVAFELQVRCVEEPYLLAAHGDAYRSYAARVGRFVPGVGRLRAPSVRSSAA